MKEQQLKLLPNYFKKIGLAVAVGGMIFLFLPITGVVLGGKLEGIFPSICIDLFLLGILIFSMSREKVEDEFIVLLRTKAITFVFLTAILAFVFTPFANLLFGVKGVEMKSVQLVFFMVLGYVLMFQYLKWKNK